MKNEISNDDLMYEISILLDAALFYAGVKKQNLAKAAEIYTENIDEILASSNAQGVDEIIEVIEFMKKNISKIIWLNLLNLAKREIN